jgi:hypothetical protein
MRAGIGLTALAAVALLAGCEQSADVGDLEATLAEHYLDPVTAAGMTPSVLSTCRFADPVDDPWHLRIEIRIDGPADRVADALVSKGVVVVRGREPMIVQQIRNEPGTGWDGILATAGGGSRLALERGDVTHAGWSDALGWAEECPP